MSGGCGVERLITENEIRKTTDLYLDPDVEFFTRLSNALLQAVQICAVLPNRSGEE